LLYLQQSVGIDFRDNTLRIVHLGRTFKGIVLIDYFINKYPYPQKGKGGSEDEIDLMAIDLRNFILERGIKPDQMVVGLPREKVILKEIIMPKVEEKELRNMLSYELAKHIPFAVEDIVFDYQILSKEENTLRVFLGVVKQDEVQKILKFLETGQMMPAVMDVTSIAEMNWLVSQNNLDKDTFTALVDIGEGTIELGVLEGREIKLSRSLIRKENHLEDAYTEETPPLTSSEEKEQIGEAHFSEIMNDMGESLGQDIIRELTIALNAFPEAVEERKIDELVLTGIDSYDSFVSEYISKKSGTQTRIANPFKNITTDNIPGKITSGLAVATGLAMRGMEDQPLMLNFLSEGKKTRRKKNYLAFTITFLVMAIVLSMSWGLGLTYKNRMISLDLAGQFEALQPDVKAVKEMSHDSEALNKELSVIEEIVDSQVSKIDLLKELTIRLPADTYLDMLKVTNEKLEIRGQSESPSDLISILEDSFMLEKVQFGSSIRKMRKGSKERFTIKAELKRVKNYEEE